MKHLDIFSDEFAQACAEAGLRARQSALLAGQSVVFMDETGRVIEEHPDGRKFEVRFRPGQPRESHMVVIREIVTDAA